MAAVVLKIRLPGETRRVRLASGGLAEVREAVGNVTAAGSRVLLEAPGAGQEGPELRTLDEGSWRRVLAAAGPAAGGASGLPPVVRLRAEEPAAPPAEPPCPRAGPLSPPASATAPPEPASATRPATAQAAPAASVAAAPGAAAAPAAAADSSTHWAREYSRPYWHSASTGGSTWDSRFVHEASAPDPAPAAAPEHERPARGPPPASGRGPGASGPCRAGAPWAQWAQFGQQAGAQWAQAGAQWAQFGQQAGAQWAQFGQQVGQHAQQLGQCIGQQAAQLGATGPHRRGAAPGAGTGHADARHRAGGQRKEADFMYTHPVEFRGERLHLRNGLITGSLRLVDCECVMQDCMVTGPVVLEGSSHLVLVRGMITGSVSRQGASRFENRAGFVTGSVA